MTQKMSPLRRRMIEDMTVRNRSAATQRSYISAVLSSLDILGGRWTSWNWKTSAPSRFTWCTAFRGPE